MKKSLFALFLLPVCGHALTLDCDVVYNDEGPFDLSIQMKNEEPNKLVGELAEYRIYAANKSGLIELQTLDLNFETRSYASAEVAPGKKIQLSHWKRDSLFEIKCVRSE